MPSTPTTKSQVQAYRFVLRRMESALVRRDPVMLHDPMRTHKRATIVGVVVGVVGLLGFLIFGILKPDASVPDQGIVVGQPSGQVYVVSASPRELIPVFNLASARLLLAARSQQSGGGAAAASSDVAQPTFVNDTSLAGFPVGRLTGIPDGPQALPGPAAGPATWAICDEIPQDRAAPTQVASGQVQTTVLVGQSSIGTDLARNQALLVTGPDKKTYLVYRLPTNANDTDDSAVRAQVDIGDPNLKSALHLDNVAPRQISSALLNAIPQVGEIQNPVQDLTDLGGSGPSGLGKNVGESFEVQNSDGSLNYYVVLSNGVEQVSQTTAQIVRFEDSGNQATIPSVQPDLMGGVNVVQNDPLQVANYPGQIPQVLDASFRPVMCLGWTADLSDPGQPVARTRVTVDTQVELPADAHGPDGKAARVQIGQVSPTGERINWFFMNNSIGLAVRAASNADEFGNGPIYLVSPRGVKYSVPDVTTAELLGIAGGNSPYGLWPAPEAILSLLPSSAETLSTQNVQRTFDTVAVPATAGTWITPTSQPASGG